VPELDLLDETFVAAPPAAVARLVADRTRWAQWWPGLALTVEQDRGVEGTRWLVAGELRGSMEFWIEPVLDGAVAHYYLRVGSLPQRARRRWIRRAKVVLWQLKDELERDRTVGESVQRPSEVSIRDRGRVGDGSANNGSRGAITP
jgi:hypothetical protein